MQTWQERLKAEGDELAIKLVKLGQFTETPAYHALDEQDQMYLQAQLATMTAYLTILTMRCRKHGIETSTEVNFGG